MSDRAPFERDRNVGVEMACTRLEEDRERIPQGSGRQSFGRVSASSASEAAKIRAARGISLRVVPSGSLDHHVRGLASDEAGFAPSGHGLDTRVCVEPE